jgi:hypothetical protein
MKNFKLTVLMATMTLLSVGCGRYIETEPLPDASNAPVQTQPIDIVVNLPSVNVGVNVGGDVIDNSNSNTANGGSSSATGGSSSATGGSNTNSISSGNSSATGGSGGAGGTASAGNSTSSANNSSSSNSTNSSTNSGSASNQANNSTNNSSDNSAEVNGSGNSSNTNTSNSESSAEVDIDQDFDFNIALGGDEDYFFLAEKNKKKPPKQCVDPQARRHMLCHAYDFTGRSQLASDLATAPHLGSFYMDKFDVTARDWQQGFPKFPASLSHLRENYAVRCFTKLRVTHAGQHTFSITSDDGMRVLLNNTPVLQDDGLHAPRTASANINLVKGLYNMEVQWFQGPRTQIAAELKWATPNNATLRYIEPSDMQKAKKLCQ